MDSCALPVDHDMQRGTISSRVALVAPPSDHAFSLSHLTMYHSNIIGSEAKFKVTLFGHYLIKREEKIPD